MVGTLENTFENKFYKIMINRDPFTGELKLDKTEKLTFGKYTGRSLATVMIIDPQYLVWAVQSNNKWRISDTWRQYLEDYAAEEAGKTYCTYMRR